MFAQTQPGDQRCKQRDPETEPVSGELDTAPENSRRSNHEQKDPDREEKQGDEYEYSAQHEFCEDESIREHYGHVLQLIDHPPDRTVAAVSAVLPIEPRHTPIASHDHQKHRTNNQKQRGNKKPDSGELHPRRGFFLFHDEGEREVPEFPKCQHDYWDRKDRDRIRTIHGMFPQPRYKQQWQRHKPYESANQVSSETPVFSDHRAEPAQMFGRHFDVAHRSVLPGS